MKIKSLLSAILFGTVAFTSLAAPTIRTICLSGCDFTTVNAAEASSIAGDILEIQDNRTYNETWTPGSERTLRNGNGSTPTVRTANFDMAGVGPITIIGLGAVDDFTFTSGASHTIGYGGSNDLVLVVDNITADCTKGNNNTFQILGSGDLTITVRNCNILGTGQSGFNITNTNASSTYVINTNYVHDVDNVGISFSGNAASSLTVRENTIRNCTSGVALDSGDTMKHNLFQDNTTDIAGTPAKANYTFNLFEEQTDTGGWGASNVFATSITFTGIPTAIPTGWEMASNQANIDAGDTTGISPDIVGTTRPQGTDYDIGCFEPIPIVVLPPGSLMMMGVGL